MNAASDESFRLSIRVGSTIADIGKYADQKEMFIAADAMMYLNKKSSRFKLV